MRPAVLVLRQGPGSVIMPLSSTIKESLNRCLAPCNLCVGTLTAERAEALRLAQMERDGHFDQPVSPPLAQFDRCDFKPILDAVCGLKNAMARFAAPSRDGG